VFYGGVVLMRLTPRVVVVILLSDAMLWGIWFSIYWNYNFRSALAYRLSPSYTYISLSLSMPLLFTFITYTTIALKHSFIRMHRLRIFKITVALSRILYIISSSILLQKVFDGILLLMIFTALSSIGFALGTIAGVVWVDYIADNIHDNLKRKYVALDSVLSTAGSLIGTSIAGIIFIKEDPNVTTFGKLYFLASLIFLVGVPLLIMLKEFPQVKELNRIDFSNELDPSLQFYLAIALPYIAINIPIALVAPYIEQKFRGNELWLTAMNFSEYLAWLTTPFLWSYILKYISSLSLTSIAIAITVSSLAVFPYLPTLELQILRSIIFGSGMAGLWIGLLSHMIRDVNPSKRIQHTSTLYAIQNALQALSIFFGGTLADVIHLPEIVFSLSLVGLVSIPIIKKSYEHKNNKSQKENRIFSI
jgi:MFS family permease